MWGNKEGFRNRGEKRNDEGVGWMQEATQASATGHSYTTSLDREEEVGKQKTTNQQLADTHTHIYAENTPNAMYFGL